MKNSARIALIISALGPVATAAPFLAIGDGAELFVTGALGVRTDDNIFLADNATSDTIFEISPGAEIVFGKNAALKGALTLVDSFANYSDNSKLNTNLFSADFRANYDDGKLKLDLGTGYHELNQNSADIRGLTRRDQFIIGTSAEVEISPITSISGGVNFTHENYKRRGYGDSDDLTVPVNFYYKWTPKVDLSFGYRYRNYETTVGQDSTDHFFNIGARGEFTPKLTGKIAVGVNTRELSLGGSETLPGFDASLTYALTPKTTLQLGASNDFGTAPQGQQQKNFALNANVSVNLTEQWILNGGLSNRSIDYYTRTDNYFEGTLGVTYIVNTFVKINAGYVYRNNDSDLVGGDFRNNVFSVSASLRY